jgi:hypothetical protein
VEAGDTSLGTAEVESGAHGPVLVRYRVVGGPVAVDQRLTVFEDGAVELHERHRRRSSARLRLDAGELQRLRHALERVPTDRWSTFPRMTLSRAGSAIIGGFGSVFRGIETSGTHYELRRGRRRISGQISTDVDVPAPVTLLDELRVAAVRAEPR